MSEQGKQQGGQALQGAAQGFGESRQERMPAIPREAMDEAQRAAADALIAGPRKGVKGPFIPLLRSPILMDKLAAVGEQLRFRCVLEQRLNEFVTLVVARHTGNQFEWAVHVPLALREGVHAGAIEELRAGARPRDLQEDERLAYDFVTELLARHGVCDATYARATAQWGEQGVLEMVTLVGYFATVCWVMNVARTPAPAVPEGGALGSFPG
jgi:4-carboxymuconolactone decarboxylase